MRETGESLVRFAQQRLDPFVIHHLGTMNLRFEYETLSVHEQVALTTLDLFTSVITSIFFAYPSM
jgi:hypothetical protein